MLKTPNQNRLPRHCQIKAVNPAFRSVSTLRCPNDLGVVGGVNPKVAQRALRESETTSEWSAKQLQNSLRNELDGDASERGVRTTERPRTGVDELLGSPLEVLA